MRKAKTEATVLKKGQKDILLDYAELRKAALVFRAINHKLRQKMIELLEENERMLLSQLHENPHVGLN